MKGFLVYQGNSLRNVRYKVDHHGEIRTHDIEMRTDPDP